MIEDPAAYRPEEATALLLETTVLAVRDVAIAVAKMTEDDDLRCRIESHLLSIDLLLDATLILSPDFPTVIKPRQS